MMPLKVYLETYGCTSNKGDTEIMAGLLVEGFELVDSFEECQVAVINSCGVIDHTERKVLKRVHELGTSGKKVVLAGCIPAINPKAAEDSGATAILGPGDIGLIKRAVREVSAGRHFKGPGGDGIIKPEMPKRRTGTVAIVPISEGCLGSCSYCGTRLARGRLKSYPLESIVAEVEECVSQGFKEIQLTSQDTGVYGMDRGARLPELLETIAALPGDFRARVGMMNPGHVRGMTDDLVKAFSREKIYRFLHLPVQSGDDRILGDMRRGYTADDFREIVRAFREEIPDITLSTDVLVGYPTEDRESFEKTYSLMEEIRPQVINITRFSPRPGTPAADHRDMPDRYKKERSRRLTKLHFKIGREENETFVGRELPVLVTESGKDGTVLARTDQYRQVVLEDGKLGERVKVRIEKATATYLIGRVI